VQQRRPRELTYGPLVLRGLRRRDTSSWLEVRLRNEEWLSPWEATAPGSGPLDWPSRHTAAGFSQLLRVQRAQLRAGTHLSYGVFLDEQYVGQVNVGSVVRGPFNSGFVGYWVDRAVAGRGVTPTAVALVADEVFGRGLHRLEINIRPENAASLRVAEKLGAQREGLRRRYLCIDGDYRDHVGYVLLAEDHPRGVVAALQDAGRALLI
jgi:ribosomal-protein-alanine N-acetyltransferase